MGSTTVCVTYDFDAVAAWLAADMPAYHSWGAFGAETATPRLLELHDRLDVPATWFVPGHTIDSFPEICGEVHDRGYEIAHHGYSHEAPASMLSREEERRDFERGIDAIYDLTGKNPDGYRAPDGGFSEETVELLEELGFAWDSSQGIQDCRPYYIRANPTVDPDKPYDPGRITDVVEIPVLWHRDDWLQLFPVVTGPEWVAYAHEPAVFDRWRREFEWIRTNVDGGVFTLLLHPQCAGRIPFVDAFETFLTELQGMDDVRFAEAGTVAAEFRAADPPSSLDDESSIDRESTIDDDD